MTVAVKGWCPACTDEAMPDHDGGRVFRIQATYASADGRWIVRVNHPGCRIPA